MRKIKVANIVGARPNFMKIAPIHRRMQESPLFEPVLIHTGQHYDEKMSKTFFVDLEMPEPDVYLGVGSGTHATQTAAVLVETEKILLELKPDVLIVVGDVNSTLAAALAATKLHIPVAHVEAGLRSFDRNMPEEINRLLTDSISDFMFVTEQSGLDNLAHEGVPEDKVHFVGNVMIDSLCFNLEKADRIPVFEQYKLEPQKYALMTLHRPSNVDDEKVLRGILSALKNIQQHIPVLFPIHPRTRKMISQFGLDDEIAEMPQFLFVEPLGYLTFLNLMKNSRFLITDSGGIQEETTYLRIPCITLRENTERPVTVDIGTNQLVGMQPDRILMAFEKAMNGSFNDAKIPELWDGNASQRIVNILEQL